MAQSAKKKLRRATIIYWLLLSYILAALIWWFISLEKQNRVMTGFKMDQLKTTLDSIISPTRYQVEMQKIRSQNQRNTTKYIGEGIIFFILILMGAAFVYRSVRRQFILQQQQQNFMMAVTHELKTPISVAMLNLETLQRYHLDPEKQRKLIRITLQETSRLNTLTNNILVSSQLEGGGYNFTKEELDLSDLLKACMNDCKDRYAERIFIEQISSEIEVVGDPLLLQLMINNLLENAVKYSSKESPITCVLERDNGKVLLHIIDEGNGIPDDEKKKIFGKFYRIGNESTRKTQGTGLGLYLCLKIAADHNADIQVTNNKPAGSRFTVTFHL
jgi:two-component system, OmpR family, sensor histidine kinase CiaH